MRLSKIKLAGFKSFVDPTTIKFPSNLMGIVGPNGCGKSNVIDAIRWVLGESSARTLRGDSMADVIFNGSSNRKPVGQASIELVFDNSDGAIGGPYASYTEVAVRRVVARDGTSNYFLNNTKCRRKDITHILLGTGLGSHGYSIIEQGMISRVVEAKAEDLRAFLEEAAGISKYKERRRETENRIKHTRENLSRLNDLRDEIEKQLTHLQRQAKDATRYKELKSEQRKVGAELLALRLRTLRGDVRHQESFLNERQVAMDAAVAKQRSLETGIEKLRVELTERNDRFAVVQGNYYKIGADVARLEQSIQHRKELAQRQGEELTAADEQLAEINEHMAKDEVQLEELEKLLQQLSPELQRASEEQRASEAALRQAEQAMEDCRARHETLLRELAESERAAHVEETRIEELAAQRARLEKTREKLSLEGSALSSDSLETAVVKLAANEESLKGACEEADRALSSVWQQIQHLREQESKVSSHLDTVRVQLQNDRGRLVSLQALQEAALGKGRDRTHRWLTENGLGARRPLAEELVVDAGWEKAVETVLGAYLQAVGVQSIDSLAQRLEDLEGGGLALIEESLETSERAVDGAWLADRVRAPRAALPLLAGIRVAETLPEALQMRAALLAGESIVTREGFWLSRHWLRVNSSDDPRAGVIARSDEIKRLASNVESTARRVSEVDKALVDTRTRLEQLEETRSKAQAESTRRQQLYGETRSKLEGSRAELQQIRLRAAAIERDAADIRADEASTAAALQESESRLATAKARRSELETRREGFDADRGAKQEILTEVRARAERDRQSVQEIAIRMESRRSSKESVAAALERIAVQRQHLARRHSELSNQIAAAREPLAEEEAALVSRLDERLRVEEELARARTDVEAGDAAVREQEQLRTQAEQAVAEAREAVASARLAVREVQVRAETVAEQFKETGFELEAALEGLPDDASTDGWQESYGRIERKIQRLGAINLAAIDEFRGAVGAQGVPRLAIQRLDGGSGNPRRCDPQNRPRNADRALERPSTRLTRVSGELFPRLFGGGHAYLELEGEDLLSRGSRSWRARQARGSAQFTCSLAAKRR